MEFRIAPIFLFLLLGISLPTAAAPLLCATPGKDTSVAAGVINAYWAATPVALQAGQTEIPLGKARGVGVLSAGDLLLVIAMQGADINDRNDGRYGDGNGRGQGSTQSSAGQFELVRVQQVTADKVIISGGGANAGLLHDYPWRQPQGSRDQGRAGWQLVRVPQYRQLALTGDLVALPWDGESGGILALDVAGTLQLAGHKLDAGAKGFRGGAALPLKGALGAVDDYRYPAPTAENLANRYGSHGSKGEGLAGTPRWVLAEQVRVETSAAAGRNASDGYPGGSMGRGAPANAGGGGNSLSFDNRRASGGGGGAGAQVGAPGQDAATQPLGGLGGVPVANQDWMLALGGGGGGSALGGLPDEQGGGGAGGGILLVLAGRMEGDGVLDAGGGAGIDGPAGGGGGGGGMLLVWTRQLSRQLAPVRFPGGAGGKGPQGQGGVGGRGQLFAVDSTQTGDSNPRLLKGSDWPGVQPGFLCRPEGRVLNGRVTEEVADAVPGKGLAGWKWQLLQNGEVLATGETDAQGNLAPDLSAAAKDAALELRIGIPSGWRVVSASNNSLTGLAYLGNGRFQLQPGADDSFRDVRLGVLREPELLAPEDRTVSANSTQIFLFRYLSHARAKASFVARTETGGQSLHYKPMLFVDPQCNGRSRFAADGQSSIFDVQPGQAFCVRLRVDVGKEAGVTLGWRLTAMTRFEDGSTPLVQTREGRYLVQPEKTATP